MEAWGKELEEQFMLWQREQKSHNGPQKHGLPTHSKSDGPPPKKVKAKADTADHKETPNDYTDDDMREHFQNNTVEKVSLAHETFTLSTIDAD